MRSRSQNTKWLVLGTVCFALFMINLDGNVVNLAMPTIIRQFGATLSQMEWISNAYLLTFAVFLITLGRLGDALGRRRMFLFGLAVFTAGSALCGAAQNVGQLIAFRVVQGIGGSAMMPATLSLITANFREEERGRAMGFWGAVAGLAFIMGPIIGGWLTQAGLGPALNRFFGVSDNWRYVFFVNLPFGVIAFILTLVVVPESKDGKTRHRLDAVGVVLSSLAVLLLTWGFVEGPRYGWWKSTRELAIAGLSLRPFGLSVVPFLFAAAAVLATWFILHERSRRVEPLMDLSLFRNRNYAVGMVTGVILNFALMGAMFLMPLYCQSVLGIDPVHTGTLLLPFAITLLVVSPLAGMLSDRIGGKILLVIGLAHPRRGRPSRGTVPRGYPARRAHRALHRDGDRHGSLHDAAHQPHAPRSAGREGGRRVGRPLHDARDRRRHGRGDLQRRAPGLHGRRHQGARGRGDGPPARRAHGADRVRREGRALRHGRQRGRRYERDPDARGHRGRHPARPEAELHGRHQPDVPHRGADRDRCGARVPADGRATPAGTRREARGRRGRAAARRREEEDLASGE